ncbi:MAG: hypothetical protein ACOX4J_02065 [Anaerovoracaceae bacterium]|jgi:hypothetical protein
MRMDKWTQADARKRERSLARKRKAAIFLLVFFFYLGLAVVDGACSEMTRYPGALTLQSKRIDSSRILLSFLGKEVMVNTDWILGEADRLKDTAKETISVLSGMVRDLPDSVQSQHAQNQGKREKFRLPSKAL